MAWALRLNGCACPYRLAGPVAWALRLGGVGAEAEWLCLPVPFGWTCGVGAEAGWLCLPLPFGWICGVGAEAEWLCLPVPLSASGIVPLSAAAMPSAVSTS